MTMMNKSGIKGSAIGYGINDHDDLFCVFSLLQKRQDLCNLIPYLSQQPPIMQTNGSFLHPFQTKRTSTEWKSFLQQYAKYLCQAVCGAVVLLMRVERRVSSPPVY